MLTLYSHLNWFGGASEVASGQGLGQPVLTSLHFHEGFTEAGAASGSSYTVTPTLSFTIDSSLQVIRGDQFTPALSFEILPDAPPVGSAASVTSYTVTPALAFAIDPDAGALIKRGRCVVPGLSFEVLPDAQGDAFVEPTTPALGGGGGHKKSRVASRYPRWILVDGQRFRVNSAREEAELLARLRNEREKAAETAQEPVEAEQARRVARRIKRREEKLEPDVAAEWLELLKQEDEELLSLLAH